MSVLKFSPYRPDRAALNANYTRDAVNVLPSPDGFRPFPEFARFTDAAAEVANGGITAIDSSGGVHVFLGGPTKLFKYNSTGNDWDDVSQTAVTYGSTDTAKWWFVQFGDYVVAGNINDAPQVFQLGSSTEFADLGGSPPNASGAAVWGDHLALWAGPTVYWSDTNDITEWATGNAGSQTFPDGGDVMGTSSVTNPVIVQADAIRRAEFMPGSLEVFAFNKIHDKLGAASAKSVCSRGDIMFFAAFGAFYQIGPDGQIASIGYEKVDNEFFPQLSGPSMRSIYGAVDPFHSRVYFTLSLASETYYDTMLAFDWQQGEWARIDVSVGVVVPISTATVGYTLEDLGSLYTSLDDVPYSLDSNVWKGGAPLMAAVDQTGRLGYFSGGNARAVIVTQEGGSPAGQMTFINNLFPLVDTADYTVSIGTRNRRQDDFIFGPELAPNDVTGMIDTLVEARFFRFRLTIAQNAEWTKAQGIEVPGKLTGWR